MTQEELQGYADRLVDVQEALLPKDLPALPGLDVTVSCQPRQVVGGDWYGVVPFVYPSEGTARHVALAVGDVCGHDVAATVVMAVVLAILRCYRAIPTSPADVMGHLNARLCEMCLPYGLTTAFLGFLSLDELKLTYSAAGHPRPLVRDRDGTVLSLTEAAGLPLGVFKEARWEDAEETLWPGSLLCLYTDGVTETAAPGGAFYGLTALINALSTAGGGSHRAVDDILANLRDYQRHEPQRDDRTLLVAQVGGVANG